MHQAGQFLHGGFAVLGDDFDRRRFASVKLFCFKPWPTSFRKEFSAASNPPPAACSSGQVVDQALASLEHLNEIGESMLSP